MYKYKYNYDLAYTTSIKRTVTVKRAKTIYEDKRSQKTDVRCQTMQKWLKIPNVCTLNAIKHCEH